MILGYNTNGFAHHRLADAAAILREIGYRSVALTLEGEHLDPPDRTAVAAAADRVRPILADNDLRATIETGSRFILDPRRKHQPTLVSREPRERGCRMEFLKAAVDLAVRLNADCVSLWSGTADDDAAEEILFERLATSLKDVLQHAESVGVRLAFEPEPGMFIDAMAKFERLFQAVSHPLFGLTLDVGHVHCLGDGDAGEHIRKHRDRLWNLHLEDMCRGVHEHLMFGDGEMDFAPIFAALGEINYAGPIHVELSRHGHDAVNIARRSYDFLERFLCVDPDSRR